jgi:hypothetical protein
VRAGDGDGRRCYHSHHAAWSGRFQTDTLGLEIERGYSYNIFLNLYFLNTVTITIHYSLSKSKDDINIAAKTLSS